MHRTLPIRIWNKPWLWPHRLLNRLTKPIPFGLWLLNAFCQRVLCVNGEIPWMVHFTSRVTGDITIGRKVWKSFAASGGCYIQGTNGIEIGDDTIFAPGVKIISANHNPHDYDKSIPSPPVVIGKHCWLGANVVVLPGVTIGDSVVIAAGAVVTKNVPHGETVAGVPAKIINKPNMGRVA